MIKAIIVDDELKAIESLSWELKNFCKNISLVTTFTNPIEAIEYLKNNKIDCIFLDIEMPNIDGLQFLKFFPDRNFLVIFTTAYGQYAIEALKEHAFDYLLKPIDSDDLIKAVARVSDKIKDDNFNKNVEEKIDELFQKKPASNKIKIKVDGKILFLNEDEILYFKSDGNYCELFLESGKKHVIIQNLKTFEETLSALNFIRVHNSYLVNYDKIKEFRKSDLIIVLSNGKEIPVSRQRKTEFLEKIS